MAARDSGQGGAGGVDRRGFLRASGAGMASLIGSSLLTGRGWARTAPRGPGHNAVTIRTHEHHGDITERLDFAPDFQLHTMHMKGHAAPGLSPAEIAARFDRPIDSAPLRDLARGKRRVVVTFDDLTRPTPTNEVLPAVLEELKRGGVKDENILLLTSYGTHRQMHRQETVQEIGESMVDRYAWLNHNIFEHLTDVGRLSTGQRLRVNNHFMAADLRVTISGIKVHGLAGYGGGGKAVLPGVAWINAIEHFHWDIGRDNPTTGPIKLFENEVRHAMEEAGRLADVNFSVQIVYSGDRKPVEIFTGDVVTAHHAACRMANQHYRTPAYHKADVVIANGYPQNMQATSHGYHWPQECLREGGTAVLIIQNPMALSVWHGLSERGRWTNGRSHWDMLDNRTNPVPQAGQIIAFSQYLKKIDENKFNPRITKFATTWDDVTAILNKRHPDGGHVALYPYATIQHDEIDLT